jgi:hypothetical protein
MPSKGRGQSEKSRRYPVSERRTAEEWEKMCRRGGPTEYSVGYEADIISALAACRQMVKEVRWLLGNIPAQIWEDPLYEPVVEWTRRCDSLLASLGGKV